MKKNCKKCNVEFDLLYKDSIFNTFLSEWLCKSCNESFNYKLESLKIDFINLKLNNNKNREEESFFPPPWDFIKYPEKSEGWVEFQKEMKKHPEYYLISCDI